VAIAFGRRPETPEIIGGQALTGVDLLELPWGRRAPVGELRAARALRRFLREWMPDVIHLHSSLAGAHGVVLAPRGLPLIYSPHSFESALPGGGRTRRQAIRAVERLTVRRASLVGAVSPSEATLSTKLGARRVVVVENGILELDPGVPLERELPERPAVVAGGRTVPQRQPDSCARILSGVRDVADVRWIGGSDGRRGAGAEGLAAAGIPMTGWVPREESLRLLGEATVYLHWTAWDGQALSILEALSRDAVVIASDIPPNRHLVGENQVFTGEAEAVDAIRRVVSDPDFAQELRAAQRRRRPRWGASRMVEAWLDLYASCAGTIRAE
jgi:glycosyltransferase involved in cell wall biosynthesis